MVFKMYVEPFETISGSLKFKIEKGKKTPYLHSELSDKEMLQNSTLTQA